MNMTVEISSRTIEDSLWNNIPQDWSIQPLKYLCTYSAIYGVNISSEAYVQDGIRFLRTTDIREDGVLTEEGVHLPKELVQGYILQDGDLLISRSGTVGRAFLYSSQYGLCSYAGYLVRFILKSTQSPRYYFYITKSSQFQLWLSTASIESTINNVNGEKYANFLLPTPPLSQQCQIADYLDRETRKIDALIGAKKRLLELLGEKRRSLITQAVTRGLKSDVPMRDSSIEFLGNIPEHWKIQPLKYLASSLGGSTPDKGNENYWNGSIPWVTPKDMKKLYIGTSSELITELALEETGVKIVEPPAILVVVRGMILLHSFPVAISTSPLTINQDMKSLRCRNDILPIFLAQQLHARRDEILTMTRESGHGTKAMETSLLESLNVIFPSLEEQREIISYIDKKSSEIDALLDITTQGLKLLKERRTSLISAAVTGQLRIPD
jgi:type I restriction enzyme, S subunit